MACLDTTVFVDLHRPKSRHHQQASDKLLALLLRGEELVTTRFNVAELYIGVQLARDRDQEAIDLCTQVIDLAAPQPQFYFARGQAYCEKGDLKRAKEDFEEVLRLSPKNSEATEKLNDVRAKLDQPAGKTGSGEKQSGNK